MAGEKLEKLSNEELIVEEVKSRRSSLYRLKDRWKEIHNKIIDFSNSLESKYPDARKCYLFNVMVGGTIDRADCHIFDFPGEDSVEKFIKDLEQEYQATA